LNAYQISCKLQTFSQKAMQPEQEVGQDDLRRFLPISTVLWVWHSLSASIPNSILTQYLEPGD